MEGGEICKYVTPRARGQISWGRIFPGTNCMGTNFPEDELYGDELSGTNCRGQIARDEVSVFR
uniref:Uncharacterized protein n=1 Tax=Romanomermis culicivorax TaxID=13658 RepID=A0A915KMV9_ROMCU